MRRIEGYVIVSSDGMIADAKGEMPETIRNQADQEFFQSALDRVATMAKPGRNDPCPCGSGNKYKKCCLAKVVNWCFFKGLAGIFGGVGAAITGCFLAS